MRITFGRGSHRKQIEIPTGKAVGVTHEHVTAMCSLLKNNGVLFSKEAKEQSKAA